MKLHCIYYSLKDKFQILDKVTSLESELHSVKDQLRLKTDEVEKEVLLKNSMHDDLAKARTMVRLLESCFVIYICA